MREIILKKDGKREVLRGVSASFEGKVFILEMKSVFIPQDYLLFWIFFSCDKSFGSFFLTKRLSSKRDENVFLKSFLRLFVKKKRKTIFFV